MSLTRRPRRAVALAIAASLATTAFAATSLAQDVEDTSYDEDARPGTPRAAGPDGRTGRFSFDASFGVLAPSGGFAEGRPLSTLVSTGSALGVVGTYGISRYVALEADGAIDLFGSPADCAGCSTRAFSMGLGLIYHLTQGVAFDPWARFGVGYRSMAFDVPEAEVARLGGTLSARYHSIDVARIALGGDFFPIPSIGFGPFVSADFGTTVSRSQLDTGLATHAFYQAGIRVVLSPRVSDPKSAKAAGAASAKR